jgi:hypothetical protein
LQDWLLNGPSIQAAQTVGQIGSEWHVGGVGEFNGISSGDATGDIVWVNTSNHVQIWAMANGQVANVVIPNGLDGIEWTLQGVGDFTDSGASELLWLDGKGDAQIWQLNGTQVSVISTTAPAGTAAMPADSAGAGSASGAADQPAGSSSSLSFGDLDGFQYVAPGDTVTNPVIQDGILQLASGAVVDGPIVFAAGSTGTLIDGDQAPLPDTVMGFTAGSDHLGFAGASAAAEAQVIAAAQTIGGNTMLTFPDHTSLVLVGVTHLDTGIFAS